MNGPAVPFPEAFVGEWVGIRTHSATGLFAYRHLQALNLLEPPDFGGGDLSAEERREALRSSINLRKPLAALPLFLGVVALEDFVRDFGARLADDALISKFFPALVELRSKSIPRAPDQAFRRLDTDPTGLIEPDAINALFERAFGVRPIPPEEYARLRDLALVRHTVAHHAAVVRAVDIPRFHYYAFRPGQPINPPPAFIRETLSYLYKVGRTIEDCVRQRVFTVALPSFGVACLQERPSELLHLIEFFDYFGFIESTTGPVGYAEPGTPEHHTMQQEALRIEEKLLVRCLLALEQQHFPQQREG